MDVEPRTVPAGMFNILQDVQEEMMTLFLTCWRFKYTDFAGLYAVIQSLHKMQLNVIRVVGMVEIFPVIHDDDLGHT